jgi:DNA-binding NtrC family response regulator
VALPARAQPEAVRRGSVLVCDDEGRLADLTAGLLRHHGFRTEAVPDGAQALDQIARDPGFQVLILDLNLHGLASSEVIRELACSHPDVRVIVTSGYSAEDVPASLLAQPNVVGYLAKPYPVDRLVGAVDAALATRTT